MPDLIPRFKDLGLPPYCRTQRPAPLYPGRASLPCLLPGPVGWGHSCPTSLILDGQFGGSYLVDGFQHRANASSLDWVIPIQSGARWYTVLCRT